MPSNFGRIHWFQKSKDGALLNFENGEADEILRKLDGASFRQLESEASLQAYSDCRDNACWAVLIELAREVRLARRFANC